MNTKLVEFYEQYLQLMSLAKGNSLFFSILTIQLLINN